MKKTFVFLIIFSFILNIQAQKSKVYVVGTTHAEHKFINPDILENLLLKINPDVVLVELDSSFFTKEYQFDLQKYPDLLSTNENISIYNYFQKNPLVKLRPFDINGRNEFYRKNDYHQKEARLLEEMLVMQSNNLFSKNNKQLFDIALKILSQYGKSQITKLSDINSDVFDKFTELKYTTYDIFIQICKTERKLKKWIDFAKLQKEFWEKRNRTMVENISRIANEFEGKKFVVFVGYEHRYFLINELKKNENIELMSNFLE